MLRTRVAVTVVDQFAYILGSGQPISIYLEQLVFSRYARRWQPGVRVCASFSRPRGLSIAHGAAAHLHLAQLTGAQALLVGADTDAYPVTALCIVFAHWLAQLA